MTSGIRPKLSAIPVRRLRKEETIVYLNLYTPACGDNGRSGISAPAVVPVHLSVPPRARFNRSEVDAAALAFPVPVARGLRAGGPADFNWRRLRLWCGMGTLARRDVLHGALAL